MMDTVPTLPFAPGDAPDTRTVNLLIAPDFIGIILSWFLYGLLVLQTFNYTLAFRKDIFFVRWTVYGVFIGETLLNIITTRVAYSILCSGWGNSASLFRLEWTDAFIPILSGLSWAQTFYAWRIYVLGGRETIWKWLASFILSFMAASSVAAFYCGFSTITDHDIAVIATIEPAILIWLISSVVCDGLIAFSMIVVIQKSRRMGIIRLTVETCILTVAGAVIMLAFFLSLRSSRLFTMMGFIVSKLYANSILVSLNSRLHGSNASSHFEHSAQEHSLRFHMPPASPKRATTVMIVTPSDQGDQHWRAANAEEAGEDGDIALVASSDYHGKTQGSLTASLDAV